VRFAHVTNFWFPARESRNQWKTPDLSGDGEALRKITELKSSSGFSSQRADLPFEGQSERVKNWFTVYTTPHHEKRVGEHFTQRQIEFFLPLYHTRHHWKNGLTANLELPLFPSYVFVRVGDQDERVRILQVPGVLFIVCGTGRKPTPLPDTEINQLRTELHLRRAEPHPLLLVGQRVRIRAGALAGMEGILDRRKNGVRVVLTLDLIQQSIAVEVNSDDLEPLSLVQSA
jgi:transcription antitermination factor NusG